MAPQVSGERRAGWLVALMTRRTQQEEN